MSRGNPPDTFAIDFVLMVLKILAVIAGIFAIIGGALWGYGFLKVTGAIPDTWLGYLAGGMMGGFLWTLLCAVPTWLIIEFVEMFISIELNTRIAANRLESIENILKRK